MKNMISFKILFLSLVLMAMTSYASEEDKKLDQTVKAQQQSNAAAISGQTKVSSLAENTRLLLDEYRTTLRKIENNKIYNEQLVRLMEDQKSEKIAIQADIDSIQNTQREVIPLMLRMISTLDTFVQLDVPFLPKERRDRIAKLKDMMNRSDVTTSEKFRRVLEAYQVENDYGRTIEAYRGLHTVDGKELTVDFLRVGRLALTFQTLDGEVSGQWIQSQKRWEPLTDKYKKSLRQGLRMARKETAPDLIMLPITTAEVVK